MDTRFFPITPEFFDKEIKSLIEGAYIWKGRPPKISHYHVFCAILFVLRTGCPWRDVPACFGAWHPIYLRFSRGGERGLWWKILIHLQQRKKLRMNVVLMDSTTMKVPPPRRGTKRGIQTKGVNRAGITTKIHLAVTAQGHVVEGFLTPGNVSDITVAPELTAEIVGCHVVADAGYDSDPYREILRGNNNIPVIPGRKNRVTPMVYDQKIYALRRRIEQIFGVIKENRRLTVRYEKSDIAFLAFVAIALIKPYL